jgi:GT2 family glycosyltransferase
MARGATAILPLKLAVVAGWDGAWHPQPVSEGEIENASQLAPLTRAQPSAYRAFVEAKRGELRGLRGEALQRCGFEAAIEAARRFASPPYTTFADLAFSPPTAGGLAPLCRSAAWALLLTDELRTAAARGLRARRPSAAQQAPTTVVILSYRHPKALRRTLRSLRRTTDPAKTEIIVVDNGSIDATQKLLEEALAAKVISGAVICRRNIGVSAGYNLGFSLASADSAFLTKVDHDQIILTPGWLASATSLMSRFPEIGIVSLDQVNHPMLQSLPVSFIDDTPVKSWWLWTCGSTMTVSREVRERILGDFLETDVKYFADDVDYGVRALLGGLSRHYLVQHCSYHLYKYRGRLTQRSKTEAEQVSKWRAIRLRLFDEYTMGKRPTFVKYSRYRSLAFPKGRRWLELDDSFLDEIVSASSDWAKS